MTAPSWPPATAEAAELAPMKELLLASCGHSFETGREQALCAALGQRMGVLGLDRVASYHALLLRDREELQRLTELLTVNETYFFREPDHLALLVDKLLPACLARRAPAPVRILSAGCSTGEEPYSLAILLRERFGPDSERLFALSGVDIDSAVIASARQGVYGKSSFRGMDGALLKRYFEPLAAEQYRVNETVRKQVDFRVANLLGLTLPPGTPGPDLILYRNVSIYFPEKVRREIFGRLAGLLAEGGYLLVGAAETIQHDLGILSLVKEDDLFFFRKSPTLLFEDRRSTGRHGLSAPRPGAAAPSLGAPRSELHRSRTEPPERPGAPARSEAKAGFDQALDHAHRGEHDRALALLEQVIGQAPGFTKARSLKGSILLSLSRFDESRTVLSAVQASDPLCLEAYLMLGLIARQQGDFEEALRRFREAIYLDPACWPAHFYLAEVGSAQGDPKRAQNGYQAALRILEQGPLPELGRKFFPLTFNAEQFGVICRHKLSRLKNG